MTPFKFLALSSVAAFGLAATGAQAQSTNSVTTTAKVKILQPITVAETNALNFGTVIAGANGTVTLPATAAGVAACTGPTCVAGTSSSGRFTVTGTKNEDFTVSMPATVSLAGPGTPLLVTLSSSLPVTGRPKLDVTGSYLLNVGGSFPLTTAQVGGDYSGTYTVSVSYN